MAVVVEGEEGDGGVYGDHEENADDVLLFPWFQVPGGMNRYQDEGDDEGDYGENSRDPETKGVEGVSVPYRFLCDCHILLSGVTFWPAHRDCAYASHTS